MMNKILLSGLLALLLASAAFACQTENVFLSVGQSYCFEVCEFDFFAVDLIGGGQIGDQYPPILVFGTGCSATTTNCEVVCEPELTPPDDFVLGGDEFSPNDYFASNDCFNIWLRWDHDDQWTVEFDILCDGCFCLTYERQLPVNLLDFNAIAGDREVQLNWTTASETNNERFQIARDGSTVAELDAAGNSTVQRHYSWTDANVQNGVEYRYELIAVDASGNREVLRETSATPNSGAGIVTEYALHQNFPNPFNPETQIAFDLVQDGFASLRVFNLLGQQIASLANSEMSAGHHVVNFNGSAFASGVYLYKLDVNGFSATKKLVILK